MREHCCPLVGTSLQCSPSGLPPATVTQYVPRVRGARPDKEVPSVSSVARGRFKATIDRANQTISYELSYEGWRRPTQAHIHFGQRHVNGGISVSCAATRRPYRLHVPAAPACPPSPATVTGVLTPANIVGPNGQGIAPS